MHRSTRYKLMSLYLATGIPWILSPPVYAATGDINSVESFIKSVITILVALAGFTATGFFVVGGLHYITSSGNPEKMDKAKRNCSGPQGSV